MLFLPIFFSLSSFLPKISLSSSHLLSLLSALSSLFALSAFWVFCWSTKLVDSVVAWACRRGGGWFGGLGFPILAWWWLMAEHLIRWLGFSILAWWWLTAEHLIRWLGLPISGWFSVYRVIFCRSGGHPSVPISAWPVPAVPMNSNLQRKGHQKWSSAELCRLVAEILNFGCWN